MKVKTKKIAGTIIDLQGALPAEDATLEFREVVGNKAQAHHFKAGFNTSTKIDRWLNLQFVSKDQTIELCCSGVNDVLGLRFLTTEADVFDVI